MFRHVQRHLSAFCHGELRPEQHAHVRAHLEKCARCQAAYEEIQTGARLAATLKISAAPASLWNDISRSSLQAPSRRRVPVLALVAGVAAVVVLLTVTIVRRGPQTGGWSVAGVPGLAQLRPGQVLQTSATSNAQVQIADIGELVVRPNSQIRLLVSRSDEHRIALDRGGVEAQTWAPPRLFIVDTPSASAVDLGCRYSLDVQDDGSSLLHVTAGLVALDHDGHETIVPAGAFCRTRRGYGAGTPFFEDASSEFQDALKKVDSLAPGSDRSEALHTLLKSARVRDGLSLWYLLQYLDVDSRSLVYDRLAELLRPPSDVTREGIIRLDPTMLRSWEKVVSQLWQ
jgi:ferric-dicitrate binding protein FerR (iron transport regulator)